MEKPHWHILGAGSIGTLFAFYLQKAGANVELIKRQSMIGSLPPSSTINVTLPNLKSKTPATNATESICFRHFKPTRTALKSINNLLLTTKAQQTEKALASIIPYLADSPTLLVLQNGMGGADIVRQRVPNARILVGSTTEGANRPQPEALIHAGIGTTWIGSLEQEHQDLAKQLAEDWGTLNLDIIFDPHINQRLWQKLAINCAINPLTVLFNCKNGALLSNPEALTLMREICNEVRAVIEQLSPLNPTDDLFETAKAVAKKTGTNISSMLQDIRAGRDTEIDFINGFIVRNAQIWGVPSETNAQLVKTIHQMTLAQVKAH